jgi:hypothetical protein
MVSAAPVAPIESKPLSEIERVVDTFVTPSKTFTDLRRSANWLVPWLLVGLASVALVMVVDKKIGIQKRAEQLDKLPPEKRAEQMETIVKLTRILAYASPVSLLIVFAIIAAVLLGSFNFGFGAELTFNQCLAVCVYASLPGILKALIAILAIAVGGGEAFTFQNPVASNLGGLVDSSSHFLYSIATSIDIFTIWTLVLTGIGISCLTKVKRGTCLGVVFGWWAILVLGGGAIAAAFA